MNEVTEAYHRWYYDAGAWLTTYLGVHIEKFVSDLWNYQEIIAQLRPGLVVEFGTKNGGSALYFAELMRAVNPDGLVFTVDIEDEDQVDDVVRQHPLIQFYRSDSALPAVAKEIKKLRALHPGPVFAILDSDHSMAHVLAEMELLRGVLVAGDYLVVEDSNLNGHPVMSSWGPGPWEAVAEYFQRHPDDYRLDSEMEARFGFTCAPRGYLERMA